MSQRNLYTRREFLRAGTMVAAGCMIPRFLVELASATASAAGGGSAGERVLVVVQLAGGNDGLNTLIPYSDDVYYRARPRLAIPRAELLILDDHVGLHPSLTELKKLFDRGQVVIVEGVGYPNPNRSHFRSMEIWHTASDSKTTLSSGWIGRYLDACAAQYGNDPTLAIAMTGARPQAFYGRRGLGVAVAAPGRFTWPAGPDGANVERFRAMNSAAKETQNASLDFVRHVMADAVLSADKIQAVTKRYKSRVTYPNTQFASDLRNIAMMIAGGLPTKMYFVSLSGFDTHANQLNVHSRLLKEFAEGIAAFITDLEQQGQSERMLVLTFSEFGRRVAENASGGTDHGTAEPVFIIGPGVRAGLHGRRPSLTNLDNGDLVFTTDFRSIYATVIEDWLGANARLILGHDFPKTSLVNQKAKTA